MHDSNTPQDGPLAGVVVVTLAINLPGPVAAARCAALGASVTTILPPSGDPLQKFEPEWFDELHAGQDVLTLNLKDPAEVVRLHSLLADADLLITSSRRAALAGLGLDPVTLEARHPRLCHVAIVGHPQTEAEAPGHDLTYQAVNGLISPPTMPTTLVADMAGAERATQEGVALLFARERTGHAAHREVALSDVAESMAEPARRGLTSKGGPLGGGLGVYGIYQAKDDWVALAAIEPHFARTVMTQLQVDGSPGSMASVFTTRTAVEWQDWATENDVPLVAFTSPSKE